MILESIGTLNSRLISQFGKYEDNPRFRVVYTNDQLEKRMVRHTKEGLLLNTPVMEERYKYRQWKPDKYVLEQIIPVPMMQSKELTTKLTYEPLWFFEDANGMKLPPKWEVIEIVVKTTLENLRKGEYAKYPDPDNGLTDKDQIEKKRDELQAMYNELYADETAVGDALTHGYGVTVPDMKTGDKMP